MKHLCWWEKKTIELLKDLLCKGMVVLGDSDTVLGLLADVSESGKASLDKIKKRANKPYLILVGDIKKALELVEIPHSSVLQFEKLINICWPGPVTLVFRAKSNIPYWIKTTEGTIALRVPNHAGLQALLQHFSALFSTSANITGEPVPQQIEDVNPLVCAEVAAFVYDDRKDKKEVVVPSTILDCTGNGIKVVRQGSVDVAELARISGLKVEQ